MAYGKNEKVIVEQVPNICEIMNVIEIPEYKEKQTEYCSRGKKEGGN